MTRLVALSLITSLAMVACGNDKPGTSNGDDTGGTTSTVNDADSDGYNSADDCDDNDGTVNPGATEVCDGIDNDCDGDIDEDVTTTYYRDADNDGFGDATDTLDACEKPSGYVPNANDCDDANTDSFPGNTEVCDGIDNDCDGDIDEDVTTTYYADTDVDGYGDPGSSLDSCSQPTGYVLDNTDCDDTTGQAFPGNLEICDEIDNDCDGSVDEDVTTTYYADTDSDTYGDPSDTEEACALPYGYAEVAGDCDDTVATTYPGAPEFCDTVDNDCDADIDEDDAVDASDWYPDHDSDSYGDPGLTVHQCYQPSNFVSDNTDCDDHEATTHPGADEYCDTVDNDCDGDIDEDDALDASDWYLDADTDGYGDAGTILHQCDQPSGYVSDDQDCDDSHDDVYPGADEYCDSLDNDCDGDIDEDGEVLDGDTFYADVDTDGLGDSDDTILACTAPSGYTDNPYDCDDTDATEPVVVDYATGSAGGAGTLSNPLDTIQDGVDRADACVVVYSGTYRENIDLGGENIDIWGVEGADYTFIDGGGSSCDSASPTGCAPAVSIAGGSGSTVTLHGFTITGGSGYVSSSSTSTTCADSSADHDGNNTCTVTTFEYCGGGIYIDGDDPDLYDLAVTNNVLPEFEQAAVGSWTQYWLYSYGGGLCVKNSNPTLENVHVYENFADQGGGLYATDSSIVDDSHSQFAENTASDGAGINISGATLSGLNLIVAFNDADTDGGGLFIDTSASVSLVNASMAHNSSASGSARGDSMYIGSGGAASMMNSIVYGSTSNDLIYAVGSYSGSYNDTYNSSSGGDLGGSASAGTGSISTNPYFSGVTDDGNHNNDDWSLSSTSPCIDAGNPSTAYYDVDGTVNDMGATGGPRGEW